MPNCASCGVSMTVSEVTARPYDGVAGNYHRDCAYIAYMLASGPMNCGNTLHKAEITKLQTKLNNKHSATVTDFP